MSSKVTTLEAAPQVFNGTGATDTNGHHTNLYGYSTEPFASKPNASSAFNYFPQLQPYSDPENGLLSVLPSSWVPYAQLMRLDRPAGFYAFYVPYLIGVLYAACIADPMPEPIAVLGQIAFFMPLNIILRGAACAWNDNLDQEFDRKVQRCRHRPIARGAVSTVQGHMFTAVLLGALYPPLSLLPRLCMMHMVLVVAMFFIYAYMKRITYYPQVVLGFPFAWAVLICVAAAGMDPLEHHLSSTIALFTSIVLWTITYDTIYAHQDVTDDEKAGVKGMAVRFKDSTKLLTAFITSVQVYLLALCGMWSGFGPAYMIGTAGGVAVVSGYHIFTVDLKSSESCGAYFHAQFFTVGGSYAVGLAAEYLIRSGVV